MPRVTHVRPHPGHRLFVIFDDGVSGEIDLSERLFGSMFEPLKDPDYFAKVALDPFGVPCWPNGADLAPDAIHAQLRNAKHGHG